MSPKTHKFADLAAPLHAEPESRARIRDQTRAVPAGMRRAESRLIDDEQHQRERVPEADMLKLGRRLPCDRRLPGLRAR